MIIAIEGIDGAGKNTLVTSLSSLIDAPLTTLSFPRYERSAPATLAAAALHGEMGDLTDSIYGMATLFALDRHAALDELAPFVGGLDRGLLVLDRYVASNAAYSVARAGGDGELADWVFDLEFSTLGLPRPDLQVLLDTAPEEAGRRALQREAADHDRARDAYERDGGLQRRTFAAYRGLAAAGWGGRWLVTSDPNEVAETIAAIAATAP